jgi:hypothetical protein
VIDGTETNPQASQYEEKGDKTPVGKSESLGVHMSDLWIAEPPPVFIKRLLQSDLTAWGYNVVPGSQQNQLHGHVNKFSLESRAASAIQFQADGMIDVDLEVTQADGKSKYKGHYVGICTRTTATEMPTQDYLSKLFDSCVDAFQKQLESDTNLRAALSSN